MHKREMKLKVKTEDCLPHTACTRKSAILLSFRVWEHVVVRPPGVGLPTRAWTLVLTKKRPLSEFVPRACHQLRCRSGRSRRSGPFIDLKSNDSRFLSQGSSSIFLFVLLSINVLILPKWVWYWTCMHRYIFEHPYFRGEVVNTFFSH
jgi:hypothetical protein